MTAAAEPFTSRDTGEPNSPEWLDARREYIGASDSAAMLGLAPRDWGGPRAVYESKIGTRADFASNVVMDIGHAMEPITVREWGRTHDAAIVSEARTIIHASEPRMGANLDSWATMPDGERVVVEAKHADWKSRDHVVAMAAGEVQPAGKWLAYYIQVQHQLEVTACERGFLAVCIYPGFYSIEITRDRELGAHLRETIGAFWRHHVDPRIPPPAGLGDTEILKAVPATPKKTIDLSHMAGIITELRATKAELKEVENRKRALENTIKGAMDDAERATFGDGVKGCSWSTVNKAATRAKARPASTYRSFRSG